MYLLFDKDALLLHKNTDKFRKYEQCKENLTKIIVDENGIVLYYIE